jgi:eukaryotic-like serine/threonine-protein kinase
MAIPSGTRLGPYEILSPLGAGGMGEVYRAKDTRLDRLVAMKVLPEELAKSPEALARFEREAKAVAALSHPSILALHDFGQHDGTFYAVMELLEGESLRQRLAKGALPARRAVELAIEMADGLAAAHDKGIVHRDLKPENVFVTTEGRVKLLDFGLAKEMSPRRHDESAIQTDAQGTDPGTVLGTARYMSPEQVRGEAVDARSDIFSFGVVLHEMLTGQQAFKRETTAESMAAILKEEPPEIAASGSGPSPALQRIVQHCLEKKPGERFQSAHDIAFALQAFSGSAVAGGPSVGIARRGTRRWITAVALVSIFGGTTVASYRRGDRTGYARGKTAGLHAAAEVDFRQMTFRRQTIFHAAFAPDGETIVFSAALLGHDPELFTIRPEYPEARPYGLPRTHLLAISSKGEMAVLTNTRPLGGLTFVGTLARVSLGSTAPREILEGVRQADWSPDGSELAIVRKVDGKDRLEFPIGKVLLETAGDLSDPRVSPGGDRIALLEHPVKDDDRGSVIVVDKTGKRTLLSADYAGVDGLTWSRSGDEVLFTASMAGANRTLYGVDLSGRRRVALRSAGGLTMRDVSRTGRWLVTRDDFRYEISLRARGATAERDLSWLDYSYGPFLSHDGSLLLFTDASEAAGQNYQVCFRRVDGGAVMRLGEGSAWGLSPDGRWALAVIHTPPQLVLYPTGPGETRRLPRGSLEAYDSASWLADGKSILACGNEPGKASRCYEQDLSGGPPRPVTPEGTSGGMVSPDGSKILYSRSRGSYFIQRTGREAAEPVPGLTSDDGVIRWNADGRSLYVFRRERIPFRIERLDPASGARSLIREVVPSDRMGVLNGYIAALTEDARSYAYSYSRMTSQLYVVEGAR